MILIIAISPIGCVHLILNEIIQLKDDFYTDNYQVEYPYTFYSQTRYLKGLMVTHHIVNDFLIQIFNLIFQILIFREIQIDLTAQRSFKLKIAREITNEAEKSKIDDDLKEMDNWQRKSKIMIAFVALNFVLFRWPELVVSIVVCFLDYEIGESGTYFMNVGQYFFMFSLLMDSIYQLKFYAPFNQAFHNLFSKSSPSDSKTQ